MPGSGARPLLMSDGTTRLTRSAGIAKPMPELLPLAERIALLTPISRPALSSSGPPELPGLMAASVWITPTTSRKLAVGSSRSSALTRPLVSVRCRPKGLPMA